MNVAEFLFKELDLDDFVDVIIEMDRQGYTEQLRFDLPSGAGVLSILSDAFDWRSSKNGYDYWYNLAHKGWCGYTGEVEFEVE